MSIFKPVDIQSESQSSGNGNLEKVRCLIIGSGPAGYTAAIYAARANLKPVLYTGLEMGGQLTTTTEVENYPGYPDGVTGPVMMEDFKKQAERFGTEFLEAWITEVDLSERPFQLYTEGKTISTETLIIASGASAKWLGIPGEAKVPDGFGGNGVSACATCDWDCRPAIRTGDWNCRPFFLARAVPQRVP